MIDHVLSLLEDKKYSEVKSTFLDMNEVDIAEVFEDIEDPEILLRLFRLLPKETAAEVFAYFESDTQQIIIEAITDVELQYILDDMYLDDYVDLVEEMPANVVRRVLANSSHENRKLVNQYLQYPEDSAGSVMTNEYMYLKRSITVREAFDVIRRIGVDKETIYTCYVISPARKLQGVVTVKELLLSDPEAKVEDVMSTHVIFVHTLDDKEEVAKIFSKYDMLSLPVVDKEERLVGIITIDDAIDVMEDEATEDIQLMAGVSPSDDSYLKTPVLVLAKNRIVWLIVMMLAAIVSGLLLEHFEEAIAALPLLVSFIPMLMDTGGNSGSQASTLIIRGMALDEIEMKDFFKAWFKEIRVALLCSAVLATLNFVRIWVQYDDIGIALTVSLTLIVTVCIAKSLGVLLPMLAKRLKLDPALMASPMITTITDATSLIVYFTIAMTILKDRL